MNNTDHIQRFLFEEAPIRGEIARIGVSYKEIINQHPYPPMVQHLLGEAIISCLLLTGSVKFEGEITLQFQGDKRLPLIIVQCTNELVIRAYAKFGPNLQTEDYAQAFLNGTMTININQYDKTETYQSVVSLESTSMGENLTNYFANSEQISTKVWLAVNDDSAAGMLIQLLPGQDSLQREHFWEYAVHLGQTVREEELLSLDNTTILHRLYHETVIRLYDPRTVRFSCRCTEDKMKQVLGILGEDEANLLLAEEGNIIVTCDFCNTRYSFDSIDVALIFRK